MISAIGGPWLVHQLKVVFCQLGDVLSHSFTKLMGVSVIHEVLVISVHSRLMLSTHQQVAPMF